MDEDKIVLVHPGFWDGTGFRNGDEVLVFTSLRTISFKDFLDDVHKIVQADLRFFDYMLHFMAHTEDYGVMKSIIMSDRDLQRVARIFKTPKIYVNVRLKRDAMGAPFYGSHNPFAYGAPTPFGYRFAAPCPAPYFQAPCFPEAAPDQAPAVNQSWPNLAPVVNQPKPGSAPIVNKPPKPGSASAVDKQPRPGMAPAINKPKPITAPAVNKPKPSDKPRVQKRALEVDSAWPSFGLPQIHNQYPRINKQRTNGVQDNEDTTDDEDDDDDEGDEAVAVATFPLCYF